MFNPKISTRYQKHTVSKIKAGLSHMFCLFNNFSTAAGVILFSLRICCRHGGIMPSADVLTTGENRRTAPLLTWCGGPNIVTTSHITNSTALRYLDYSDTYYIITITSLKCLIKSKHRVQVSLRAPVLCGSDTKCPPSFIYRI